MNPVIAKARTEIAEIEDRIRSLTLRRNQLTSFLATFDELAGQLENNAFTPKKPVETNKAAIAAVLLDILSDGVRRRIPELLPILAMRGLSLNAQNPENALSVLMSTDRRFEPSRRDGWTLKAADDKTTKEEAPDAAK